MSLAGGSPPSTQIVRKVPLGANLRVTRLKAVISVKLRLHALLPVGEPGSALSLSRTCDAETPTSQSTEEVIGPSTGVAALAGVVSAEFASQLTQHGMFRDPVFPARADWITPEAARTLALQYTEEFLVYQDTRLERQHGADIDFGNLTVDSRVELAETPYVDAGGDHPAPLKRALGSFYLVTLRSHGTPAISVAVSVHATNLSIQDGHLVASAGHGNEFRSAGIPIDGSGVSTPERAAMVAAMATGGAVSSRPRFIREGFRFYPQRGVWAVELTGGLNPGRALVAEDGTVVASRGEATLSVETPIGGGRSVTLVRDGAVTRADFWTQGGAR